MNVELKKLLKLNIETDVSYEDNIYRVFEINKMIIDYGTKGYNIPPIQDYIDIINNFSEVDYFLFITYYPFGIRYLQNPTQDSLIIAYNEYYSTEPCETITRDKQLQYIYERMSPCIKKEINRLKLLGLL